MAGDTLAGWWMGDYHSASLIAARRFRARERVWILDDRIQETGP